MYRIQITCAFLILWSATAVLGGQVFVTNTADSGAGSLREAITRAQSPRCSKPCEVMFNIGGPVPAGGYWTIAPSTGLPVITEDGVLIDGATQSGFSGDTNPAGPEVVLDGSLSLLLSKDPALTFRRPASSAPVPASHILNLGFTNWLSGAIVVEGSDPNNPIDNILILDNYIGVEADGVTPAPNRFAVSVSNAQDIYLYGNVISANGQSLIASSVTNLVVGGNTIGMDAFRTTVLGNGDCGICLHDADESVVLGNDIAGHRVAIGLTGLSRRGYFSSNTMIGSLQGIDLAMDGPTANDVADLDSGPNDLQNYPELSVQRGTLIGTLDSTPNAWFQIDICSTSTVGARECQGFLDRIYLYTNSFGQGMFIHPIPAGAGYLTAAATGETFSTSEFASPVRWYAP